MTPNKLAIFIIGNWNPRIFTPAWIKTKLFELKPTDEIEGLVNFDDMDFAFRHNNITIVPKYNILEITTENVSVEINNEIANIITKIFELLPQTPVKALGINLKYNFEKADTNNFIDLLRN